LLSSGMDDSEHDPMMDLEAALDEQENSQGETPIRTCSRRGEAEGVPVGASIFTPPYAAPEARKLLLGKNLHIVETPKTCHTNANPDQGPFKDCVPFLEKHDNPTKLKYTKFFMVEFGGVEQMEMVYTELERNKCDMIGVCSITGMLCCAFARRTLVKKPIVLHGVGQINGYYIIKNKVMNSTNLNDFAVNLIQAWLQIGTSYLVNFKTIPVAEMTASILDQQWKDKTLDQCEWGILRRKRSMQVVISSYKVLAEDENVISLKAFVALDSVLCKTSDVLTGELISIPVLD